MKLSTYLLKQLVLMLSIPLCASLSAATYYVDPAGSDSNTGASAQPFKTIQRAANTASAGDTVYIRPGVYRETVTPANSGTAGNVITYTQDPATVGSGTVVISGADLISGWTLDSSHTSGKVYKATMNWDLDSDPIRITSNQVFVDGQMMNLARWPNNNFDVSRPIWAIADDGHINGTGNTTGWMDCSDLAELPSADYSGAYIHLNVGESWSSSHGEVTSIAGNRVEFSTNQYAVADPYQPHFGSWFYIADKKELLDTYGEWWHDESTNSLYLWSPTGDDPTSMTVEAKRRHLGFDLQDRHYITISNIEFFACTIITSRGWEDLASLPKVQTTTINFDWTNSIFGNEINAWFFDFRGEASNITLDSIKAKYITHATYIPGSDPVGDYWSNYTAGSGIVLNGTNNKLLNSVVSYSSANGVAIIGENNTVDNCIIHDVDYMAIDGSGITAGPSNTYSYGHTITNNDVYNSGRSLILVRPLKAGTVSNNHLWNAVLQTTDSGGINCFGVVSDGTVISYNIIQDCVAPKYGAAGIYLDEYSTGHIVHHNLAFNTHMAMRNNMPRSQHVYNNTFLGLLSTNGGLLNKYGNYFNWNEDSGFPGVPLNNYFRNNIFGNVYEYRKSNHSNNLPNDDQNPEWDTFTGAYPLPYPPDYPAIAEDYFKFTDAAGGDFTLQSTSPAVNYGTTGTDNGVTIPAYALGGNNGAPDAGAFEYGRTAWTAGSSLTPNYPNPPSHLTASSVDYESITLQWQDNSNNEEAFYLERSEDARVFTTVAVLPANTTTYTDKIALGGYYYRVRADQSPYCKYLKLTGTRSIFSRFEYEGYDETDPADPDVDKVGTGIALPAFSWLRYDNVKFSSDVTTVTMLIDPGYGDIPSGQPGDGQWYDQPGYDGRIEFRLGSPTGTLLASIRPEGPYGWSSNGFQTFNVSGFPDTTADLYVVTTAGGIGNADWFQFGRANQSVSAPLSLTENNGTLTWSDTSNNELGFRIEQSSDNITWVEIAETGANVETYTVPTGYFYRIRAFNIHDYSDYSNKAGQGSGPEPETTPNPPTSLTASSASATSATLTWQDNSLVETGFRVEMATSSGGPYSQVATTGENITTATVGSLTAGNTYYFRVYAYNGQGNSNYSNTTSLLVEDPNAVPDPEVYEPFDGALIGNSSVGLALTWSEPWNHPIYDSTGLSFGTLPVKTGGIKDNGNSYVGNYRTLNTPLDPQTDGVIYMSMLQRYDGLPASPATNLEKAVIINWGVTNAQINFGIWEPYSDGVRHMLTQMRFGTWKNNGIYSTLTEGKTYLHLLKFEYVGGEYKISSWVYDDIAQVPETAPSAAGSAILYGSNISFAATNWSIQNIGFAYGGGTAGAFDELRIGTDYAAVVPMGGSSTGFSSWISSNYSGLSDQTATGDPDNDGVSNFMEYALGLDPSSPTLTGLPTIADNGTNLDFSFNDAQNGVTYQVQISTNGMSSWSAYGSAVTGDASGSTTISVPKTQMVNGKLFIRLQAVE